MVSTGTLNGQRYLHISRVFFSADIKFCRDSSISRIVCIVQEFFLVLVWALLVPKISTLSLIIKNSLNNTIIFDVLFCKIN